MQHIRGRITLFLVLLAIWFLLVWPGNSQSWAAGLLSALVISLIAGTSAPLYSEIRATPRRIAATLIWIALFMVELVKSNIDVAFRVLDPQLPIRPGIVKVKTALKSRIGRIVLANSITLTPGTITVETRGDIFYIHWIDIRAENIEESTEAIVRKFERYLEVIFG